MAGVNIAKKIMKISNKSTRTSLFSSDHIITVDPLPHARTSIDSPAEPKVSAPPSTKGIGCTLRKAATIALTLAPTAAVMSWMAGRPSNCNPRPMGAGSRLTAESTALQRPTVVPFVGCNNTLSDKSCFSSIIPSEPLQAYLAACLIIKDDPDFSEWITYHRRLGVTAFYIFDHDSVLPLPQRMTDDTLHRGDVHYQYINTWEKGGDPTLPVQAGVFNECLRIGRHHPWMTFNDVDEYIVPSPGYFHLPDFMRQFEGQCALTLNWRVLGSGNHELRPSAGVVNSYTQCVERENIYSWWTKVIVNPPLLKQWLPVWHSDLTWGNHKVSCLNGTYMVDENLDPYNATEPRVVLTDKIALYHYMTRSLEDFSIRTARKTTSAGPMRDISWFNSIDSQTTATCTGAQQVANFFG